MSYHTHEDMFEELEEKMLGVDLLKSKIAGSQFQQNRLLSTRLKGGWPAISSHTQQRGGQGIWPPLTNFTRPMHRGAGRRAYSQSASAWHPPPILSSFASDHHSRRYFPLIIFLKRNQ